MKRPTERNLFTKACRLSRKLRRSFTLTYAAGDRLWLPSYEEPKLCCGEVWLSPCHTKTAAIAAIVNDFIEIEQKEKSDGVE